MIVRLGVSWIFPVLVVCDFEFMACPVFAAARCRITGGGDKITVLFSRYFKLAERESAFDPDGDELAVRVLRALSSRLLFV